MRNAVSIVIVCCLAMPSVAAPTVRTSVHFPISWEAGAHARVTLQAHHGRMRVSFEIDRDFIALVFAKDRPGAVAVQVNGYQETLPPLRLDSGALLPYRDDREGVGALLGRLKSPESVREALARIATGSAAEAAAEYYTSSFGDCGVGGNCHDEAMDAFMQFLGCAGSIAVLLEVMPNLGIATLPGFGLATEQCFEWGEAHEAFLDCCTGGGCPSCSEPCYGWPDCTGEPCAPECIDPDFIGPLPECCSE